MKINRMDVFIRAQRVETKSGVGFECFFGGFPKKTVTTKLFAEYFANSGAVNY